MNLGNKVALYHDPNSSYSSQINILLKVQQNIKDFFFFLLIDNIILVFMHCRTVCGNDLRFTPYGLETQHGFMLCSIFTKTFVFLRHILKNNK